MDRRQAGRSLDRARHHPGEAQGSAPVGAKRLDGAGGDRWEVVLAPRLPTLEADLLPQRPLVDGTGDQVGDLDLDGAGGGALPEATPPARRVEAPQLGV